MNRRSILAAVWTTTTFCVCAGPSVAAPAPDAPDDRQKTEQQTLERFAPVLMVTEPEDPKDHEYPIDILWWVQHAKLEGAGGDPIGELNVARLLELQAKAPDPAATNLAIGAGDDREWVRDGRKAADSPDAAGPRTVYGMMSDQGKGVVRLAYFCFYGFSDGEDNAELKVFDHHGDWMCVDFDIDLSDAAKPRFTRAIYHNHGRQFFVDDPDKNLSFADFGGDRHPRVWLEAGTHETWPCSGDDDGFASVGQIPKFVWTNNRMDAEDIKDHVGGEIAAKVVEILQDVEENGCRAHDGKRELPFERVVNVGSEVPAGAADDVKLFHEYKGRWGEKTEGYGSPPMSPRHQPAMWSRQGWKHGEKEDARGEKE